MPGRAHKQELFRQLIAADSPASFAEQRQLMWNLFPLGQVRLRQAIADDFYQALPRLSRQRHDAFLHSFASNLAPLYCEKPASDRLQIWLKAQAGRLSPLVERELQIALQDDLRCQKIVATMTTPPPAPARASPRPR